MPPPRPQALCVPIRQVVGWFQVAQPGATFSPRSFPVFILEKNPRECWYGFPEFGPQPGEVTCRSSESGCLNSFHQGLEV